jgi:hypothetical protein
MSPEIIMYIPALILDIAGLLLLLTGTDDFGFLDVIGLIIIGGWIFLRSFGIEGAEEVKEISTKTKTAGSTRIKAEAGVKKFGARKWLRIICIGGEFIPYLGSFFFWTILVWGELREKHALFFFEQTEKKNETEKA